MDCYYKKNHGLTCRYAKNLRKQSRLCWSHLYYSTHNLKDCARNHQDVDICSSNLATVPSNHPLAHASGQPPQYTHEASQPFMLINFAMRLHWRRRKLQLLNVPMPPPGVLSPLPCAVVAAPHTKNFLINSFFSYFTLIKKDFVVLLGNSEAYSQYSWQ